MEYTVRFTDENREVRVPAGTTLLQARIAAGLEADAPCGGGEPAESVAAKFGARGRPNGMRC